MADSNDQFEAQPGPSGIGKSARYRLSDTKFFKRSKPSARIPITEMSSIMPGSSGSEYYVNQSVPQLPSRPAPMAQLSINTPLVQGVSQSVYFPANAVSQQYYQQAFAPSMPIQSIPQQMLHNVSQLNVSYQMPGPSGIMPPQVTHQVYQPSGQQVIGTTQHSVPMSMGNQMIRPTGPAMVQQIMQPGPSQLMNVKQGVPAASHKPRGKPEEITDLKTLQLRLEQMNLMTPRTSQRASRETPGQLRAQPQQVRVPVARPTPPPVAQPPVAKPPVAQPPAAQPQPKPAPAPVPARETRAPPRRVEERTAPNNGDTPLVYEIALRIRNDRSILNDITFPFYSQRDSSEKVTGEMVSMGLLDPRDAVPVAYHMARLLDVNDPLKETVTFHLNSVDGYGDRAEKELIGFARLTILN